MRIQADDLQVGDIITSGPGPVTVRELKRGDGGDLITNPDAPDEIKGHAWEWVDVDRPRASALTDEQLTELRERARREAGPFVQPHVLNRPTHNPEWAAEVLGRPSGDSRPLTWPDHYLLYLAALAEPTPPPPPLATARLAQQEAEQEQRRQAEAAERHRKVEEWQRLQAVLRDAYGVRADVRHNYTSHRHLDGYTQGGDHIYLLDDLNAGRLHRDAHAVLCYVPSRARDLQHFEPIDDGRTPSCKACLATAARLAARADTTGRAPDTTPADTSGHA
ncbi:hypothetical protein [Streptomyces sp. SAI-127]|uniref:hypothetical protein n=1 Tax=Streptomyces sp. SAI-127 TaxID=2940543 RepID=UPI0024754700|nr:hypothetical protein [Streptomyces sp. SAI-127]MDH6489634.1 hypothetical protein [Streptomyces sp. SAI-127]